MLRVPEVLGKINQSCPGLKKKYSMYARLRSQRAQGKYVDADCPKPSCTNIKEREY